MKDWVIVLVEMLVISRTLWACLDAKRHQYLPPLETETRILKIWQICWPIFKMSLPERRIKSTRKRNTTSFTTWLRMWNLQGHPDQRSQMKTSPSGMLILTARRLWKTYLRSYNKNLQISMLTSCAQISTTSTQRCWIWSAWTILRSFNLKWPNANSRLRISSMRCSIWLAELRSSKRN